jgi:type III pantothenate kinase
MNLVLDIGNTRIKYAVFEGFTCLETDVLSQKNAVKQLENIFEKFPLITHTTLASVGKLSVMVLEYLHQKTTIFHLTHQSKFPFKNNYSTPETLGIDRMVTAAGAVFSYPNQNRLIIDAGTCITYDLVTKNNEYLGGAISPGIGIRLKALHQHTEKLPLVEAQVPENYIGNSTKTAIQNGVLQGIIHEIEGFIKQYSDNFENLTVILTGGDTIFLAKQLKSSIFANSNFLINSLYQLFLYNSKK